MQLEPAGSAAHDDPFPQRRHLNALNSLFLVLVWDAILTWTERAQDELARWDPSNPDHTDMYTDALIDEALTIAHDALDRSGLESHRKDRQTDPI